MSPALAATVWVASGGALGSVARYWTGVAVTRFTGAAFPWGTLLINVLGSFVIGYFGMLSLPEGPRPASPEIRLFVLVGICGGFTTFSSFSMQTIDLLRDGEIGRGMAYIVFSVALCLGATVLGIYAAQLGVPTSAGGRP